MVVVNIITGKEKTEVLKAFLGSPFKQAINSRRFSW
jgi:hypothetical protein